MHRKMFNTLSAVLTQSYVWAFLLCWNLLDSSNYELNLFLGNIVFAAILSVIFILITNKPAFSILLTLLISTTLNFASDLKAEFLSTILNAYDFNFLFHIRELAGEELIISYLTKGFVIYILLGLSLILYVFLKSPILLIKTSYVKYIGIRICAILSAYAIYIGSTIYLKSGETFASKWMRNNKYSQFKKCNETMVDELQKAICYGMGPFLDIASGLTEREIKGIPGETSSGLIKSQLPIIATSEIKEDLPNIILVLNESTFDPTYLDYPFASELKFDFFNDTKYLQAKGIMKVHTFGGASSLSEFPSLTGIIHDVFRGPTTYPFLTMAKITKSSLLRELKKVGYYNIVVYPVQKSFVNAQNALHQLGADKIVNIEDYNFHPKDWRDVPEKLLGEMIDSEISKAPAGMPVFLYVSTMRNHGPHNKESNATVDCPDSITKSTCNKLNDYLSRLKLTDKEWMEYNKAILGRDKKTVIINYGDHLPSFEGDMHDINFKYPDGNNNDIYRTFYNIRANYPIRSFDFPVLDISYFPSIILDIIERNNNEFYRASAVIRDKCNGLLLDCHENKELVDSYKALIIEQLEL